MANPSETIGAILIGALVSAVLSGTVTTQAFIYFRLYGGDDYKRNTFMSGVAHLPIRGLDTLHSSMAFASVWIYLIRHWGDSTIYDYIPCFFAHRIYILSGFSWWLTAPILVLACGRLANVTSRITLHSYEAFVDRVGWVFTMGLSLSTAVDVLITVTLIVLLQRSRTGFSTVTDHLIDVVTLYTIETGLWLVMPRNLIFLALHFSISKRTSTDLPERLNARKSLRRRTRNADDHILPMISSLHEAQSETQQERPDVLDANLKSDHAVSAARIRVTRVNLNPRQNNADTEPEGSREREEGQYHHRLSREQERLPPV
ncbi:hypothetical protein BV20DRAFT_1076209 [Pilatotrama ljubarskyi]|nr:hypothetical protein BV20DRAFT_1076209 [Pilatotrama ljubarskyi]